MSPCSNRRDSSDSDESGRSNKKHRSSGRKSNGMDKNTEEYKHRREKNNLAVKKCRSKSKMKTQLTLDRVNTLREENAILEGKIQLLTKELSFLKDLFLAHAGNAHGQNLEDVDWEKMLTTDDGVSLMSTEEKVETNGGDVQNDHKYTFRANIKFQV
uniref:BZIP domain-containing protein n=1 Tax=Strigamia maritima TaxID=126957 RepID=T1JN46_STRMM